VFLSSGLTSATNTTNAIGITSEILRLDKRAGNNTVNITAENITQKINVTGTHDEPYKMLINYTPQPLYADHITSPTITAIIIDQFENPVPIGNIKFEYLNETRIMPLNSIGRANVSMSPSPPGNYTVDAEYLNEYGNPVDPSITNSTVVIFQRGQLAVIELYANPRKILIHSMEGKNESTITAIALDAYSNPLSGILLNFTTDIGTVNPTEYLTQSGVAEVMFWSDTVGNATITARNGTVNASVIINVTDQAFVSIVTYFNPTELNGNGTINVTTIVSGEGKVRKVADIVLVNDRSGSMRQSGWRFNNNSNPNNTFENINVPSKGWSSTRSFNISSSTVNLTGIAIEAEDANRTTGDFEQVSDASASNGSYMNTTGSDNWNHNSSTALEFDVNITEPGSYYIWGRVNTTVRWNTSWHYRIPIKVNASSYNRTNYVVEQPINFTEQLSSLGVTGTFDINSIRVVEYNGTTGEFENIVPYQFDKGSSYNNTTNAVGDIIWIMNGTTLANNSRYYYVYFDIIENGAKNAPNYTPSVSWSEGTKTVNTDTYKAVFNNGYIQQWYAKTSSIPNTNILNPNYGGIIFDSADEWRDEVDDAATYQTKAIGPIRARICTNKTTTKGSIVNRTWTFYPDYFTVEVNLTAANPNYRNMYARIFYSSSISGSTFEDYRGETANIDGSGTAEITRNITLADLPGKWMAVYKDTVATSNLLLGGDINVVNYEQYWDSGDEYGTPSWGYNSSAVNPSTVLIGFVPHPGQSNSNFAEHDYNNLKNKVNISMSPANNSGLFWGFSDDTGSFWVSIDNGTEFLWDFTSHGNWSWTRINDPIALSKGIHTFRIEKCKSGTSIDKLILTNDPNFIPTGFGNISSISGTMDIPVERIGVELWWDRVPGLNGSEASELVINLQRPDGTWIFNGNPSLPSSPSAGGKVDPPDSVGYANEYYSGICTKPQVLLIDNPQAGTWNISVFGWNLRPKGSPPPSINATVKVFVDYANNTLDDISKNATVMSDYASREAAKTFVGFMNDTDRVGYIPFGSYAVNPPALNAIHLTLLDTTANRTAVNNTINNTGLEGGTAIQTGINASIIELESRRDNAIPVIVLLTDGQNDAGPDLVIAKAAEAKGKGIIIFTIGLTNFADGELLSTVASNPQNYYYAPDASDLAEIYAEIAQEIQKLKASSAWLNVTLSNGVGQILEATYVPNTAQVTYWNETTSSFHTEYSEPTIYTFNNYSVCTWDPVGDRPSGYIRVGHNWTVTYQVQINTTSFGSMQVLNSSIVYYEGESGITMEGSFAQNITINSPPPPLPPLPSPKIINLTAIPRYDNPPPRIKESAYKLIAHLEYDNGDPVAWYTRVDFTATSGTFSYTFPKTGNNGSSIDAKTGNNGNATVYIYSDVPGTITVTAYHITQNDTRLEDSKIVWFNSTTSVTIVPVQNPRGTIILE